MLERCIALRFVYGCGPSWRMLIDRALASEFRTGSVSLTRLDLSSDQAAWSELWLRDPKTTAFMSSHRCSSRTHIARTAFHPFQRTVPPPRHTTEKTIAATVTESFHVRGDIEYQYGYGCGKYSQGKHYVICGGTGTVGLLPGIHEVRGAR